MYYYVFGFNEIEEIVYGWCLMYYGYRLMIIGYESGFGDLIKF